MKKLSFSSSAYSAPSRRPRKNPRVGCGTVSAKRNKYVGALIDWRGKQRKVVGCATDAQGTRQYATRVVGGKKSTRYTPIRKGTLRDLAWRAPKRVEIKKRKAGQKTTTSERLLKAWEAKYAKKAARTARLRSSAKRGMTTAKRKRFAAIKSTVRTKLHGAALAAHQKRLASGKKAARRPASARTRSVARRGRTSSLRKRAATVIKSFRTKLHGAALAAHQKRLAAGKKKPAKKGTRKNPHRKLYGAALASHKRRLAGR